MWFPPLTGFLCSQLPSGMLSFSQLCHLVALKFENSLWKEKFLPKNCSYLDLQRKYILRCSSENQKWATGSHTYTWLTSLWPYILHSVHLFWSIDIAFWIEQIPPQKPGREVHRGSGHRIGHRIGHLHAKAILQISECLEHPFSVWRVQAAPHVSKVSSMYLFEARLLPMDMNFHIDSIELVIFPTRLGSHTCNQTILRFQIFFFFIFPLCLCLPGFREISGTGNKALRVPFPVTPASATCTFCASVSPASTACLAFMLRMSIYWGPNRCCSTVFCIISSK